MSIPRVIHYCWFGKNPKDITVRRCIRSWRKYCPGYEIVEWNEQNFDVNAIPYTAQAYACGKWAFVSDYARLKVIFDYGGIYLDTDVELKKPLDSLLSGSGFLGLEKMRDIYQINTGLGFGAVCRHPLIKKLMESYHSISFCTADGKMDLQPCSERNTELLKAEGLEAENKPQMLGDFRILPTEYLCPVDYFTGEIHKTKCTIAVHHYQATWKEDESAGRSPIKTWVKKVLGNRRYHRWAMKKRRLFQSVFR